MIYRSVRSSKGAITVAYSVPGLRQQGWTFDDDPLFPDCTPDGVNGFRYLHQAYTATDPNYTGKVTVPTLWDKKTRRIVNNESPTSSACSTANSTPSRVTTPISTQSRCARHRSPQ